MKKLISLMLVVLLLASAVVSCGVTEPDSTAQTTLDTEMTTNEPAVTEATTESNLDANGYWKDDLPEDLDLKGAKVTILYDNNSYAQEFISDGINGDLINDAIYNRNEAVASRLNTELVFVGANGRNDTSGFISTVNNDVRSGAAEYELIGTYSQLPGSLAINGSLVDLLTLDYLNFE